MAKRAIVIKQPAGEVTIRVAAIEIVQIHRLRLSSTRERWVVYVNGVEAYRGGETTARRHYDRFRSYITD